MRVAAQALPRRARHRSALEPWQKEIAQAAIPVAPLIRAGLSVCRSPLREIRQQEPIVEPGRERVLRAGSPEDGKQHQAKQPEERLQDGERNAGLGQRSVQLSYGCIEATGMGSLRTR